MATPCSNYIHSNIMTGAYPGHADENLHNQYISNILFHGINMVICLQEPFEMTNYRDYISLMNLEYYNFPIKDRKSGTYEQVKYIVDFILYYAITCNRKIYLHCQGGHGRTGMISTILIKKLYNMNIKDSLKLWYEYHDSRVNKNVSKTGKPGRLTREQLKMLDNF